MLAAELHARSADFSQREGAFRELARSAAGRARAWEILRETCDRAASGISLQRESGYFEREVRQLGRIVAWADSKVTEQRSLTDAGAVTLHVLDDEDALDALLASEIGDADVEWGYRPAEGELNDLRAHFLERERLLQAGDLEALRAYCARVTKRLLSFDDDDRAFSSPAWTADALLGEAVDASDDPALLGFVLGLGPSAHSVRWAAARALALGRSLRAFELLLAALPAAEVIRESMGDTLLSAAARARRADATAKLLALGARPNDVFDGFHVRPPFECAARDGNGPMVNSVRAGDSETLALLLAAGGDPHAKTRSGRRVLDLAEELGDAAIIAQLGGADAADAGKDLGTALATDDVARVLELLPSSGTAGVALALQECAQNGRHAVLGPVLASGATLDSGALAKALWYAAANGHTRTVELLLAHGADPNGFVQLKMTARKVAKTNRHTALEPILKKAGGKLR